MDVSCNFSRNIVFLILLFNDDNDDPYDNKITHTLCNWVVALSTDNGGLKERNTIIISSKALLYLNFVTINILIIFLRIWLLQEISVNFVKPNFAQSVLFQRIHLFPE